MLQDWAGHALGQRLQEQLIEPVRQCLAMRFARGSQRECRISLGPHGAVCEQPDTRQRIELTDADTDAERFTAWLSEVFPGHKPGARVSLSEELVLTRKVRLPQAARKNLSQVLGYEMDRLSPFESDQVYFHFTPESAPDGPADWLVGRLILARKQHLDPWYRLIHRAGISIERVTLTGSSESLNLKPQARAGGHTGRRLDLLLGLSVLLMITVYLGGSLWQERQIARDLEQVMQQARKDAGRSRQLQDRVKQRRDAVAMVTRQRAEYRPLSDIMLELTRLIPDDSWFRQVNLNADQVSVSGESDQASELIGLLERSPLFESVRFKAPVVRNRKSGKENFDIILILTQETSG
ncbi:MAG: PilN domain-containing protein [Candidatus Thiodiazotropha sp.]